MVKLTELNKTFIKEMLSMSLTREENLDYSPSSRLNIKAKFLSAR